MEIISLNAVRLKLLWLIKIQPVINISCIHPYKPAKIPHQHAPEPPPVEIDGELEYEVEQILDSRLF
jgi:hypothetical protein